MNTLALIPVFPLLAFMINILAGKVVGKKAAWVSILSSLISLGLALPVMIAVAGGASGGAHFEASILWLELGKVSLRFGYLVDPLAATLLFVVTIVGTLIQIYSMGYMHDDPRYSRFFAYVSLFMAAMLTLVIADNLILFFIAWEIMGCCSYLLIGFWFEKDSAANAGRKAFLTTRVGDVGFFIGILTLFAATGTFRFADLAHLGHGDHGGLLLAAALFIFCGTIGKSAQFPLHVWLPDAMEGPTPVSALIHAATMVAAGVYLVARAYPLFMAVPDALPWITAIGTITAFMAAFIALTATDIKKVLAYSTISQLGYMVTALGLGGFTPGVFHLMTHAYFKALLFMGAGSVIHGTGTQEIKHLGGVLSKMKHTGITFILASLAIAGVPPLSGFWSKDEILATAYHSNYPIVYWILLLTAFMTSFYMFRLVFLTFFGKSRNPHAHMHESPATMTLPLWILAIGAVFLGLPASPWMGHWLQGFLAYGHHGAEHEMNLLVMGSSVAAGLLGILLAAVMYLWKPALAETAGKIFRPFYLASINKFWMDEFYAKFIVRPFHALAKKLFDFDKTVIDGAVNGTGFMTMLGSQIQGWIDKYIVDGLVNFTGYSAQFFSAQVRKLQTGFIQSYLLFTLLGLLLLFYLTR